MPNDDHDPDGGDASAGSVLASEIRRHRKLTGLSHAQLGTRIGYSRQYVSIAERPGKGLASGSLVRAIDDALHADGALITLHAKAVVERRARRPGAGGTTSVVARTGTLVRKPESGLQEIALSTDDQGHGKVAIIAPAGRFFAGSRVPARTYPAVDDGRIVTAVPAGFIDDPFMRRPRRGLVVGAIETAEGPRFYGLDVCHSRRRLAETIDESHLLISHAYALDDLTLGLLWALANLDDPLLDDDTTLTAGRANLDAYERLPRSSGGPEIAGDLAQVSRMWLGSDFCARHIMRHGDNLNDAPTFWTREQRGEEASTWIFFRHKYAYLRDTVDKFGSSGASLARAFCIPRDAVAQSSRPERALLMLALALMESFGIRVDVCDEPEYMAVPGFVLDRRRRAIVANWVGSEGIWHVDVTAAKPVLREFVDATEYAQSHSAISSSTPEGRLRKLADYLGLDGQWLARRCAELADYGSAGLVQPRSRLLSVDGVDRACRFLAGLHEASY